MIETLKESRRVPLTHPDLSLQPGPARSGVIIAPRSSAK